MRLLIIIAFASLSTNVYAQTLGGAAIYNFLKLPPSSAQSAAGGVNVSMLSGDAGFSPNNPALLNEREGGAISAGVNAFFKGTRSYAVTGIIHAPTAQTTFAGQIFFVDYGAIPFTNAAGAEEGTFRPRDFYIQGSAARSYGERFRYGANLKFVYSDYGTYNSSAIMADIGLLYHDSTNSFRAGLTVKNMGLQLKSYNTVEDLPFDLQIGVTKKLSDAPFGFSITAQQVHQFNSLYNDTLYNAAEGVVNRENFGNRLFNHFVAAVHVYAGSSFEISAGYNRLRRYELNTGSAGNGLNGFSAGFLTSFKKIRLSYARSYYGRSFAYNQVAIQFKLSQLNIANDL